MQIQSYENQQQSQFLSNTPLCYPPPCSQLHVQPYLNPSPYRHPYPNLNPYPIHTLTLVHAPIHTLTVIPIQTLVQA